MAVLMALINVKNSEALFAFFLLHLVERSETQDLYSLLQCLLCGVEEEQSLALFLPASFLLYWQTFKSLAGGVATK